MISSFAAWWGRTKKGEAMSGEIGLGGWARLWIVLACLGCTSTVRGGVLTLQDYLDQVRGQGPDYQRAVTNHKVVDLNRELLGKHWTAQASVAVSDAGNHYDWYYGPYGQTAYWNNQYGASGSLFAADSTSVGLNPSLNYSWQRQNQSSGFPGNAAYSNWGDDYSLQLGVPLWQDFLGAQVRYQDQNNYLSNDSQAASWDYQIPAALLAATQVYESLAYDRAVAGQDQDLIQRYQRLADWAVQHGKELDQLQARAALENEAQALERAQDQVRLDQGNLNRLRGVDGLDVGDIQDLDALAAADGGAWPQQQPDRLDLQASKIALKSEDFQVLYYRESVKLPVNLNLNLGGNLIGGIPGTDSGPYAYNPALTEPNVLNDGVSLGVTVPFDYFLPRWTAPLKTVELQDAQQRTDLGETTNADSQQWDDMTIRFNKSEQRIKDAAQLQADQQRKAELGEAALAKGKLDIYEALSFEAAYTGACLGRLQWVQQRLTLQAQARLFQAQAGAWRDPLSPAR
jgi:hypothetical protein